MPSRRGIVANWRVSSIRRDAESARTEAIQRRLHNDSALQRISVSLFWLVPCMEYRHLGRPKLMHQNLCQKIRESVESKGQQFWPEIKISSKLILRRSGYIPYRKCYLPSAFLPGFLQVFFQLFLNNILWCLF